jgi:hypothetical protein
MSTYEFQINSPQDQYQTHVSQHAPTMLTPASMATPGPSSTPGAVSTPQPIIIQYDASQGKHPYGTGDHDEGFNLEFENLAAFNAWKLAEEDNKYAIYCVYSTTYKINATAAAWTTSRSIHMRRKRYHHDSRCVIYALITTVIRRIIT